MPKSFWNVIAVALPLAVALLGWIWTSGISYGIGDYGGRMGVALLFILGIGAVCALGTGAAFVALARGESRAWLSIVGLVGNLAVVLPIAGLLLRR
jgi:hypothetical protein